MLCLCSFSCYSHTGFGPLCVALSVEAIKLLTMLMTDLEMESLSTYVSCYVMMYFFEAKWLLTILSYQ